MRKGRRNRECFLFSEEQVSVARHWQHPLDGREGGAPREGSAPRPMAVVGRGRLRRAEDFSPGGDDAVSPGLGSSAGRQFACYRYIPPEKPVASRIAHGRAMQRQ